MGISKDNLSFSIERYNGIRHTPKYAAEMILLMIQIPNQRSSSACHMVERISQISDLIRGTNRHARTIFSLRDQIRRFLHLQKRLGDFRGQEEGKKRRKQKSDNRRIDEQYLDIMRIC